MPEIDGQARTRSPCCSGWSQPGSFHSGAEGEARTFDSSEIPADWFGGTITLSTLRVLSQVHRLARRKDNELDMWDFKAGYEAHVREWIIGLRDKLVISSAQVETLIEHRKKTLAADRKAAKYQGLNAEEIASIEASEKNETLQSKLNELGSMALELQKLAAEELKKNGADLRNFLANKQSSLPVDFPTPAEIAAHLTPGDAKSLVQELIKQYVTKPDRLTVFKVLRQTCNESWHSSSPRKRQPKGYQEGRLTSVTDPSTFLPGRRAPALRCGDRVFFARSAPMKTDQKRHECEKLTDACRAN